MVRGSSFCLINFRGETGSILTYQRQNHQNLSDFFIVLKEKMLQQRH